MNVLYLHGHQSSLKLEKREILEKYFVNITAPTIDYDNHPDIWEYLQDLIVEDEIDTVIGSSLGAFFAFYLAHQFNIPCLLFNPAMVIPETKGFVEQNPILSFKSYMQVVIGRHDDIVNSDKNIRFFWDNLPNFPNSRIHIMSDLHHLIPADLFDNEIASFYLFLTNN